MVEVIDRHSLNCPSVMEARFDMSEGAKENPDCLNLNAPLSPPGPFSSLKLNLESMLEGMVSGSSFNNMFEGGLTEEPD
ncbi:hypothetical protein HAX54_036601 [Datura stramonium]|uniref:Uncharacterized protein n=1 Tax=Datura stramonium TaxID=4076 RepID=A0ABS8VJE6_DATST|nr:hypothetical protein [Datura stramonium]